MTNIPPLPDEGPPLEMLPAGPEPVEVEGCIWIAEVSPESAGWSWVRYKRKENGNKCQPSS